MMTMDNTVVNIVKSTIKVKLHKTDTTLEWVMTGYILIFSCLMIPGGRLVDFYGQRFVFALGMSAFTASSLMAGLSTTTGMLIVSRLVQGTGAALALPATMVAINVGRTERQKAIGMIVWVGMASVAAAFGPGIGAAISSVWGWQGIFFINVLPGLAVIPLGLRFLDGVGEKAPTNLDLPGLMTSGTMLFALSYALTKGPDLGWRNWGVLAVFALAAVALVSLVLVERWAPDPIFDTVFFHNKVFSGALLVQILLGLGFNGILYYGAIFMQTVLGFGTTTTALVFLPPAALIGVFTPLSFVIAARIGPRITVSAGVVLMAAGMVLFSTLHHGDHFLDLMPGVVLVAIGSGLAMPLPMYVLSSVPDERRGVASGILNVGREMSGALGITLLGALIYSIQDAARRSGVKDAAESFRRGTELGLPIGAAVLLTGAVVAALTLPRKRATDPAPHGPPTGEPITHVVKPLPIPRPEPSLTAMPTLSAPPPWPLPRSAFTEPQVSYDPYDPLGQLHVGNRR
jgi:EmrB/QacA subfamily drug resistance transporter